MNAKKALEAFKKVQDKSLPDDEWVEALQEFSKESGYAEEIQLRMNWEDKWTYNKTKINDLLNDLEELKKLVDPEIDAVEFEIKRPDHVNTEHNWMTIILRFIELSGKIEDFTRAAQHADRFTICPTYEEGRVVLELYYFNTFDIDA